MFNNNQTTTPIASATEFTMITAFAKLQPEAFRAQACQSQVQEPRLWYQSSTRPDILQCSI
jgi:hypothetical protein